MNDDEIVDLARYGRDRGVTVRFIEFMPLDADGGWRGDQVVPQAEILARHRPRCGRWNPSPGALRRPSATGTSTARARSA